MTLHASQDKKKDSSHFLQMKWKKKKKEKGKNIVPCAKVCFKVQ